MMWKEERFQRIRALLQTFGRLTIQHAANELNVSRETIRRDYQEMEDQGELKRIRGGAVPVTTGQEPPIDRRSKEHIKEKRAIAKTVAGLVNSGDTIFIDTGSTTSILAEELGKISGITIITNSLHIAQRLSGKKYRVDNSIKIVLLGGFIHDSLSATFGEKTVGEIFRHHADIAILSPVGIDATYGATSYDPAEAEIARAMVENAERVFLLADYSKIGVKSSTAFCPPSDINILITNEMAENKPEYRRLKKVIQNIILVSYPAVLSSMQSRRTARANPHNI